MKEIPPLPESTILLVEAREAGAEEEASWRAYDFEEFDVSGQVCGGAIRDGRYGFGTAIEVLTSVTGRPADDWTGRHACGQHGAPCDRRKLAPAGG